MNLFLDTSTLLKLYHEEAGTTETERIFEKAKPQHVYLSAITKVEITSAIWEKVRTKDMLYEQASEALAEFQGDFSRYQFVPVDPTVLESAKTPLTKYRTEGLRTLDSIQLATCITLRHEAHLFLTSDNLLKTLVQKEGLPAGLPEA